MELKHFKWIACCYVFAAFSGFSCLHFDQNYPHEIKENSRQFFIYSQNDQLNIVIHTEVKSGHALPKRLALVLPFPALPIAYQELKGSEIFQELAGLIPLPVPKGQDRMQSFDTLATNSISSDVKVHSSTQAGHFTITPLEITKVTSNTQSILDEWLVKNKFNSMPIDRQKKFLKKGHLFLAIEANFEKVNEAVFNPLQITLSWPQGQNYEVPLSFSHANRNFLAIIYLKDLELIHAETQHHVTEGTYPNTALKTPILDSLFHQKSAAFSKWKYFYKGKNSSFVDPIIQRIKNRP